MCVSCVVGDALVARCKLERGGRRPLQRPSGSGEATTRCLGTPGAAAKRCDWQSATRPLEIIYGDTAWRRCRTARKRQIRLGQWASISCSPGTNNHPGQNRRTQLHGAEASWPNLAGAPAARRIESGSAAPLLAEGLPPNVGGSRSLPCRRRQVLGGHPVGARFRCRPERHRCGIDVHLVALVLAR
jgi:hypothetical protein